MAKDVKRQDEEKPSIFITIAAALAGIIAVKIAAYAVTAVWRLATREDPPDLEIDAPGVKKAAWIALISATTGAARQIVRDAIKPPTRGPA